MAIETSFRDSVTADSIKGLMLTGIKNISLRDISGRIYELYEAPLIVTIGDPCVRTLYKFIDGAAGSSRQVIAWEEEVVAWPGYEILQVGAGDDINALP